MTSTKLVRNEIAKFLSSEDPEVLCVTGDWGVGKTYAWNTLLKKAADEDALGLKRYSYVSLFGLNSLAELKRSIAENLQIFQTDELQNLSISTSGKNFFLGSVKYLKGFTSAIPYIGKAVSESGELYFSLIVNSQIVCLDDLERRGASLRIEDVFGLISSLKEERLCKVALLLNEDQLGEGRKVFDLHFEKVIDSRLVFAPTAAEAVVIALPGSDEISQRISKHCASLGISNIRVIKKIERMVRTIDEIIPDSSETVKVQTAHTLTILGWTKFQPDSAPPFDFYSTNPYAKYLDDKELTEKQAAWQATIEQYGFEHLDCYDAALMDYVKSGIADDDVIRTKAREQDEQVDRRAASAAVEAGFRAFHDSFDDNLDDVTTSILDALKNNFRFVPLNTLNDAVALIKSIDRPTDALGLLAFFKSNLTDVEFWKPENDPFHRSLSDQDVKTTSEEIRSNEVLIFNPVNEMLKAAQTMNADVLKKLALILTPNDVYRFIKERRGEQMRAIIHAGLDYRKISNASPDMQTIVRMTSEALRRIGNESKLNAVRVKRYSVSVEKPNSAGETPN